METHLGTDDGMTDEEHHRLVAELSEILESVAVGDKARAKAQLQMLYDRLKPN